MVIYNESLKLAEDFVYIILKEGVEQKASDIHLTVGAPPAFRKNGLLYFKKQKELEKRELDAIFCFMTNQDQQIKLTEKAELDFIYEFPKLGRFRVHAFKQRNCIAMAIRIVEKTIRRLAMLNQANILQNMLIKKHGLILLTGTTGSGKSTTLAAMLDWLNQTKAYHIITLEDPIEYIYPHQKSLVNQREYGLDFFSFHEALRAALREDPDVIMVGELRDAETMFTAITASETGHLVLGTLHTFDTVDAINRIISMFPAQQQDQIRMQLAMTLQGVIAQQLILRKDGKGRVCAMEILVVTSAIRNLIREGKVQQIFSQLQTGRKFGMNTMAMALQELLEKDIITKDVAISCQRDDAF
jgi:twitching motility protein PilT